MDKFQLAWVLHSGEFDPVQKLFDTKQELDNWAKSFEPKQDYVWRLLTDRECAHIYE